MKSRIVTVPAAPQRRHRVLFDRDLPFRGRREQIKTQYRRTPKHRQRDLA